MRKKKIISSLLIISMMMCLMPLKMFMATEPDPTPDPPAVKVKIVADKETATKGGKVTYTIKIDPDQALDSFKNLGAFKLKLTDLPEKLTFDTDSAKLDTNVRTNLGIDEEAFKEKIQQAGGDITKVPPMISFDESNKVLLAYGCNIPDTTTGEITLATFSCTVSDQANVGDTLEVGFAEHTLATKGSETTDPVEITSNAVSATVTVTDAPQYKIGDINNDGRINSRDVKLLFDYVSSDGTDPTSAAYIDNQQ